MKVAINKEIEKAPIRDHRFFLSYIKILGMVLFGIALTTPVLGLIIYDVDVELMNKGTQLENLLIWDKPILPYLAGFLILVIHWFKFTEVHHYLENTDLNHIIIIFGFFFVLSLYPYFEMNIEFTSDQPHSRAVFSGAWGLLGLFSYWVLAYANKKGYLSKELSSGRIAAVRREILADPIVALICVGVSYIGFVEWLAAMVVLVPIANFLMAKISIEKGH